MRHRHNRLLGTTPCRQSPIVGCQEAVFVLDRRPGCLEQRGTQIAIAFTDPYRLPLAGALVLPWCQPDPTGRMRCTRKAAHISAQFGDDDFGYPWADPWQRIQERTGSRPIGSWRRWRVCADCLTATRCWWLTASWL